MNNLELLANKYGSSKNLNVCHFQNGDPIPEVKTDDEFGFAYFWVRNSYVMLGSDSHDRYWDEMGDDNSFGFSVRCVED
jgi:hypothetical protein